MGQLRLLGEPAGSDDHAALANLAFPQAGHTGFVAAAGLAGGQTIIGGTAPSENLSLQSTAGSPRGVVRVIDDLRLVSGLIQDSGGASRITLATATPHIQLTGDLKLTGYAALAGATPGSDAYLKINPSNATWGPGTVTLLQMNPSSCAFSGAGSLTGFGAYATINALAGSTSTIRGLQFVAFVGGQGIPTELSGATAQVGCMSFSGAIPDVHAFYALQRFIALSDGSISRSHGLRIANQGKAGVGTTFGLLIEPQLDSANCYSIWAGANYAGTPRLRLDEGTPGANQTMLYLAEGLTPTLRRVEWKNYSALVAGDRVMVLV